ncbi:Uncharacterized protein conserved in bacteria [uncultured Clostridium sp.]|nr:Uncharacterized protein conserved in bacteria [uncultured Clostridium sp.]
MRMSELKKREVINVCDCRRLGFVGDLDIDPCSGKILAIIVPGPGCVCGFLGREKDFVIPFDDICQIGDDIILVRLEERKEKPPKPPKPGPPPGPPCRPCPCPPPCEPECGCCDPKKWENGRCGREKFW